MTQVYFHCSNPDEVLIDRRGAAVLDLAEARDHAARVVQSMIAARTSDDWRQWVLHIADDLGEEIFSLSFASVLGPMQ
jgi:hypothetical protein